MGCKDEKPKLVRLGLVAAGDGEEGDATFGVGVYPVGLGGDGVESWACGRTGGYVNAA